MRKPFPLRLRILFALALSPAWAATPLSAAANADAGIKQAVVEFLQQQADGYPGTAQISVEDIRSTPEAACDDLQVFLPSGQRLRSRMSVGLRCLAPAPWTARVQAHLSIDGFFYVANRPLDPGEIVSLDDLIPREGDILSLPRNTVVDPSQLIDQVVTRRIPAGTPLKTNALRSPLSIQRGQMVRTEAHGQGFIATGEGQSLQDGAPGEQIRVRTRSGQVISATVMDASTVRVMM